MTLIVDTEPHASNTQTTSSMPPGPNHEKTAGTRIVPVNLTCYQVLADGAVRGYVCVEGTAWECFVGQHLETARSIGLRESLTTAIRDVVAEGN